MEALVPVQAEALVQVQAEALVPVVGQAPVRVVEQVVGWVAIVVAVRAPTVLEI